MKRNRTFSYRLLSMVSLFGLVGFFTNFQPSAFAQTVVPGATITDTQTWTVAGSPYLITGNVTITSTGTLNLDPGVILKFSGTGITVEGTLNANGIETAPVAFTSFRDDEFGGDTNNDGDSDGSPGDWYSVLVEGGGTANLTYTTVRYGGADYSYPPFVGGNVYGYGGTLNLDHCTLAFGNGYGVRGFNGSFTVQNSAIENNNNYGLYLSSSTPPITPVIKNNTFLNNTVQAAHIDLPYITLTSENFNGNSGTSNGLNGLVLAGALANSSSLAAQPSFPYILAGIDIINSATLTLDAGAVLKMMDSTGITVTNGILTANGVLGSPVTITSLRDDTIDGDTNNNSAVPMPPPPAPGIPSWS